ncbi:MMPL family transporter [Acetobacterium paludosum]|uniref:MMPL family transporter n=2 Tax=Acetobacterium paludosum TaxID=52693 RepID=A0A923KVX7_9FIRM|nr:MMPL family transporter [Acetobacterium paludosum]
MLNKMGTSQGESMLLVFNDENQLSDNDMNAIETGINELNADRAQLQITNLIDSFSTPEAKDQLLSADNTTLIIPISFEKGTRDNQTVIKDFQSATEKLTVTHYFTGAISNSYDMKNVATHDIIFTQIIVLMAIFILLIGVTISFRIPAFIVGSLLLAYYTALSATAFIAKFLFSSASEGLSWNVPFFSFVMIAALGVDYSIFLMDRYREDPDLPPKQAIVLAARNIGGVVMSAGLILAGTFATLYPSNIIVLMELAICVVIGLFLLAFVLLPVAIPALIALTDNISTKEKATISAAKNGIDQTPNASLNPAFQKEI